MKSGCDGVKAETKKRSISLPVLPKQIGDAPVIAHSKTAWWRAVALVSLTVLMGIHIIQWRIMGTTVSPIEPSEAMFTLQNGAITAGFVFFTLAILATFIFGRFVCGWGCHIVALQDFCAWLLQKFGLKPRPFRSRLLVFVPLIVALYMFVWPTVLRAITKPATEPLIPAFTNHLITTEFWATFPPWWLAIPFLFICGFMTVYFLGQKGFCTYACPYGGFFGVADKFAPGRIRVTDACNECGHCTATCTSNVIVHAEVKQYGMVIDPGCMKCMDCISVCPNDALYFGFGKPAVGIKQTVEKNFSLTWPEEIAAALVFAVSYFAIWDVYQLIPMLMALGVACVTTFVVMKCWRILRKNDTAFYSFSLKYSGRVTAYGWIFIAFSLIWVGLNLHSGFIRYNERAGGNAFANLRVPDELGLAGRDASQWLTDADKVNVAAGQTYLGRAERYGLMNNPDTLPKLAWFEHLSGNTDAAINDLATSAEHQTGQAKALSLYYRGALLNRSGRYAEALTSLDAALTERADLVTALEERGESLWHLGRREEAAKTWADAVNQKADLPLANNFLSAAAAIAGDKTSAEAFAADADRATPEDPRYFWMLGLRLQNLGFAELAEKQFSRAIQRDPRYRARRLQNLLPK